MKKLLYAGVVGPLLFIAVFLAEGFTRPGYSQWRNFVSQLSTGETGWVQVVNFLVSGVLILVFALGLRSVLKGTRGAIGAPVLLSLFSAALLVAGIFSTDPGLGYPPGVLAAHTGDGAVHGLAGLFAFTLLPAAAFVMAWHFAAESGSTRWVIYSVTVGVAMLVLFVAFGTTSSMDMSGAWPDAPTGLLQRIAIIAGWTWIAMVAWRHIRGVTASQRRDGATANR